MVVTDPSNLISYSQAPVFQMSPRMVTSILFTFIPILVFSLITCTDNIAIPIPSAAFEAF